MPDDVEIPQFALGYLGRGYGHPEASGWRSSGQSSSPSTASSRQQRLLDQVEQATSVGDPDPEEDSPLPGSGSAVWERSPATASIGGLVDDLATVADAYIRVPVVGSRESEF